MLRYEMLGCRIVVEIHRQNLKEGLRRVIISRRHLGTVLSCLMCPLRGNAKRERARSRPSFKFWRPFRENQNFCYRKLDLWVKDQIGKLINLRKNRM